MGDWPALSSITLQRPSHLQGRVSLLAISKNLCKARFFVYWNVFFLLLLMIFDGINFGFDNGIMLCYTFRLWVSFSGKLKKNICKK